MNTKKWTAGILATAMLLTLPLARVTRAEEASDDSHGVVYSDASVRKVGANAYDTQHAETFKVQPGDKLQVKTTVDASVIRKQIESAKKKMEKKYGVSLPENMFKQIKLSDLKYQMTLVIHWDSNLEIPDPNTPEGLKAYRFEPDPFEVKSIEKNGTELTVTMGLKNSDSYQTFDKLWNDIYKREPFAVNRLALYVDDVQVKTSAQPGKLVSTSELTGDFSATASYSLGFMVLSEPFSYNWTSEQDKDIPTDEPGVGNGGGDGTDSTLDPASKTTSLTLEIVKPTEPTPPTEPDQPKPSVPAPTKPNKPGYFKPVVPPTKPDPSGKPQTPSKDRVPNTGAHA